MLEDGIDGLARSAKEGDERALERLYEALRPMMARHVARRAGGIIDRSDLEQQGFIILIDLVRRWQGRGPFAAWFQRVFPFAIAKYHRRALRLGASTIQTMDPADLVQLADARAEPEDLDPCDRLFCHDLLRALPPPYRRLIWWRFVEGLSYREIELEHGLPAASAQRYCERALDYLRAVARGENPPPLRVSRRQAAGESDAQADDALPRLWALVDADDLLPSAAVATLALGLGGRAYDRLVARLHVTGCIFHARGDSFASRRGRRWRVAVDLAEAQRRLANCQPRVGPL